MLYINNELVQKDKEKFKTLKSIYQDNLSSDGNTIVTPITIKYIPDLVRYEPSVTNEQGRPKEQKPNSLALLFVSHTNVDGEMVEMRYSRTAPRIDGKTGSRTWSENQIDVKGRLQITDIDLLYFFEFYSNQNASRSNSEFALLMVEDVRSEAKKERDAKKDEILINTRLWNDEADGGCKDEKLYEFAESVNYKNIRSMDANQLRKTIEHYFKSDRFGKQKFISFTTTKVNFSEGVELTAIEADARKYELITQINPQKKYYWKNADGTNGEVLFDWTNVQGDESVKSKFLAFLKDNPEVVELLKERIAEKKGVTIEA